MFPRKEDIAFRFFFSTAKTGPLSGFICGVGAEVEGIIFPGELVHFAVGGRFESGPHLLQAGQVFVDYFILGQVGRIVADVAAAKNGQAGQIAGLHAAAVPTTVSG